MSSQGRGDISLEQVRKTLQRYSYDKRTEARVGSDAPPIAASSPRVASEEIHQPASRIARLKHALRRLPLVAPILVGFYRLVKAPSRIALLASQVEAISQHLVNLTEQQNLSISRVQGLAGLMIEANGKIQLLQAHSNTTAALQEDIRKALADSLRTLGKLSERGDFFFNKFFSEISTVKPVIHAGQNLIISRIDDFIMAFPAEEWRLPTYQILVGQLEPGLFSLMKKIIREGMVVIDIGANVGTYTLLALRAIGKSGTVISYEPTPRVFDILKNNVQVNGFLESGRIDLRQKAVSDRANSSHPFFVKRNALTHSSFFANDEFLNEEIEVIEVPTISLDDDLGPTRTVDVIKIDAEGAEPAILRGMQQIIDNNPKITIFIEFAPQHLARARVDPSSYLAQLRNQGFELLEVVEPTGDLRSTADDILCERLSVNLMLRKTTI